MAAVERRLDERSSAILPIVLSVENYVLQAQIAFGRMKFQRSAINNCSSLVSPTCALPVKAALSNLFNSSVHKLLTVALNPLPDF